MDSRIFRFVFVLLLVSAFISGCTSQKSSGHKLKVVASTTLVKDVVQQVGGDYVELTGIYPVGADPHTFEPRPQDAAAIADAQIIFLNGLELEHSLEPLIETNAKGIVVKVSDGIDPLPFTEAGQEGGATHSHAAGDPHTWMDPNLVKVWVENIKNALSSADPEHAKEFAQNAEKYTSQLSDLDAWIQQEVSVIPAADRKLVTDHENLGYFVHRYDFTLVGLVVDSLSTGASPSAQELSKLEDLIKEQKVKAVFVGSTVNPALSEQISKDTGARLVVIDTESLGDPKSDISNYLDFMKKMVTSIVEGLK